MASISFNRIVTIRGVPYRQTSATSWVNQTTGQIISNAALAFLARTDVRRTRTTDDAQTAQAVSGPTGPCCRGGTCIGFYTSAECSATFGVFASGGTSCNSCIVGAWCSGITCAGIGYAFQNLGSTFLAGATCSGCIYGICCTPDGCVNNGLITQSQCASYTGSKFFPGLNSCSFCTTGVCCTGGGTCSATPPVYFGDCISSGITFYPAQNNCSACTIGACCTGGNCSQISRYNCQQLSGIFFAGQACTACDSGAFCGNGGTGCLGITFRGYSLSNQFNAGATCNACNRGTCCVPNGTTFTSYVNVTQRYCSQVNGTFFNEIYNSNACATGSCCIPDSFNCLGNSFRYGCTGVFNQGQTCGACETGKCCFKPHQLGYPCQNLSRWDCEFRGGRFFGGETCDGNSCTTYACCNGTTCTDLFYGEFCSGVSYPNKTCSNYPCNIGSCCLGGTCMPNMRSGDCVDAGGIFTDVFDCSIACITGPACVVNFIDNGDATCIPIASKAEYGNIEIFPGRTCGVCETGICCTGDVPPYTTRGQCELLGGVFFAGATETGCDQGSFCTGSGLQRNCIRTGFRAENLSETFIQGASCDQCAYGSCCKGGTCISGAYMDQQTCVATGGYFFPNAGCTSCITGVFCKDVVMNIPCVATGYFGQALGPSFFGGETCSACDVGACCTGGSCIGRVRRQYCAEISGEFVLSSSCDACIEGIYCTGYGFGVTCQGPGKLYESLTEIFVDGGTCSDCYTGVFCTGEGLYSTCFSYGYKAQNLTNVFIQGGTCSDCQLAACCTGGTCIGITGIKKCNALGGKTFAGQTCSACDIGIHCDGPTLGNASLYLCPAGTTSFRGSNTNAIFISGATSCTACDGGVFCTGSTEKKTCIGSGYRGLALSNDFNTTTSANCNLCIQGACCTGGSCAGITTAQYCTTVGGTFYAGLTCFACSSGGESLGACCTGGSCAGITSSSNCKAIAGLFLPGSTCSSCDYGVFCQGITCARLGYRGENLSSTFLQGGTCSSCHRGVCCKNGSCLTSASSQYGVEFYSRKECEQIGGATFIQWSNNFRGCNECKPGVFCTGSTRYGSTCDSFGIYGERKTSSFIVGGTCGSCVPSICCKNGTCSDTTDYDVSLVLTNWGKTGPTGTYFTGDYDGDGVVGTLDLGLVLTRWYGNEDNCIRNGGIYYRGRTCGNCNAGSQCSACDTGVYCTGSGTEWTCLGVGSSYANLGGVFIDGANTCDACNFGAFCTGPTGVGQTCAGVTLQGFALSDRFQQDGDCDDCITGVCCETGFAGYISTAAECVGETMLFTPGATNPAMCNQYEAFTEPLGICCRGITCSQDGTATQCEDGEFTELSLGLSFGMSCETNACERGICCKESDVTSVTGGQCLGEMTRIKCALTGGDFFSFAQGASCSNCLYIPMLTSAVARQIRKDVNAATAVSTVFTKNVTGQTGNEIQPRKENKFKAAGNWTDKSDTWLNKDADMYGERGLSLFGLRRVSSNGIEALEFNDVNFQNNSPATFWKPWWMPGSTGITLASAITSTAASGIFDAPPPANLGLKSVLGHTLAYIRGGVGTNGVYPVPRYIQVILGYDNPEDPWHNTKLVYRFYGYSTNGPRYGLVDATRHAQLQSYQSINEFPNPNPFIGSASAGGTFEAFSSPVLISTFAENPLKFRVRPVGSCCVGATCIGIVTKDHCEFAGGTFNEGSRCYACYPELIYGNCCTGGTHAGYMNLAQCNQLNGTFFKGNTFDAEKCVYGTICKQDRTCLDPNKSQSYKGSFSDVGGNFFVVNSDLGCAACNFGLCCSGATCYGGQPKAVCDQYNGTIYYDEPSCSNNCDMGICCKMNGACGVYTNRAACNKPDEVFLDNYGPNQPCTACESLMTLTQFASGITYTYVFNKSTTFGTFFDGSYWVQETPGLKLMKVRMTYTSLDKSRVYNYNSNTVVRNLQLHPNGYKGTVFVHGLMKNPLPLFYRGTDGKEKASIHALQSIVYGAYDQGWSLQQRSDATENPNNYREFDLVRFNNTREEFKAGGITLQAHDVLLACTTNFDPNRMTFPKNNSGFPYQVFQSRGEVLAYGVINCLSAQNAALAGSTVCFRPPTTWQQGEEHNKPIYPVSMLEGRIPGQPGQTLIQLGNSSRDKAVVADLDCLSSYSQVSEFGTGFNYQHNSPVWAHYGAYSTNNTYGEQWTAILNQVLQGLWGTSSRANQNLSLATRRLMLQRLVQYGIDAFGAMKIWAHLSAGAGQKAGRTRSWAMIAGYYLGITAMRNPEITQLGNTLAVQEFLKDWGRDKSDDPEDTLYTVGSGACVSKGQWMVYHFGSTGPENNYRGLRTMLGRHNSHERQTMVETTPFASNLARYHDFIGRGHSFTISGLGIVPFSGITGMTFSTSGPRGLTYSNAVGVTLNFGTKNKVKLYGNFAKFQIGDAGSTYTDNPFAPYYDPGIKIGGSLQLHKLKVVSGAGAGPTEYKILRILGDVRSDEPYDGPGGGWQFYLDRPWQNGIPNFNSVIKLYPFSSADSGATRPCSFDSTGVTVGAAFFVIERKPYKCPAGSDSVLFDGSPSPHTSYFSNSLDAWAPSYAFMDFVTRTYGITFEVDAVPIMDYMKQYVYTSPYNLECLYPWYSGNNPNTVFEAFFGADLNTGEVLKSRINFARDFPGAIRWNNIPV